MKIYQIVLHNRVTRKTIKVESFPDTPSCKELRKRLLELQGAYCESNEVPEVKEQRISSDGFLVKALTAKSDSNYYHIAKI